MCSCHGFWEALSRLIHRGSGRQERRGGLRELAACATMCNDAEIGYSDGQYTRVGEPTEAALKVRPKSEGSSEDARAAGSVRAGSAKERRER